MPPECFMLIAVAILLGLHGAIAAPVVMCVCTSHVFTPIYQSGDRTSMPVGYMYENDCKVNRPEMIYNIPGFYAVEHYHQVGYVKIDSGIAISLCPPHMDNNDRLTTPKIATPTTATHQPMTSHNAHLTSTQIHVTAAPVTSQQTNGMTQQPQIVTNLNPQPQTQTTILPVVTSPQKVATLIHHGLTNTPSLPRCNKIALFNDIAFNVNVGTHTSTACADGKNHDSDGTITVFCNAPDVRRWRPDTTISNNCADLPPYTPVAAFGPFGSYKGSAGVFLGCSAQGFNMATQNCSSKVHIEEVTLLSAIPADQFYVVSW